MNANVQPSRPRLLFVDDEARVLMSLRAIFRADYDVTTAEGGAAALEALRSRAFDVVISDQRMPGMTGVEVLRAARELQPRAIRLLLTGYADLQAIIASINEGEVFRYISKPWVNNDLRNTVGAAVRASAVDQVQLPETPATTGRRETLPGVLVVDQEAESVEALRAALGSEREVHAASSVDEALETLGQHRIGVVFTELQLGGQSMTPLLIALREHHPALVVVVMTRQADAGHSIELINHGQIFRLLLKPVGASVLRGTVNIASRRYELLSQHPEQNQRVAAEVPPPQRSSEVGGLMQRLRRLLQPRS